MIYAAILDWNEALQDDDENDALVFLDEQGKTIAELELPAGLMRKLIDRRAESYIYANLDGTICSENDGIVDAALVSLPIDELIERDLAPDMLEDEPGAMALLQQFKARLQRAQAIVDIAIKNLPD